MEENKAWDCFKHTGNVSDYLIYSQCKRKEEQTQTREDQNENGCRGLGYHGEARG